MQDFTYEAYNEIVKNIINQDTNKIEAKNILANILEKYAIKPIENDPQKFSLSYNVERYLAEKERQGLSPATLYTYRIHLKFLVKFLDKKIQSITKDDIYNYLDYRADKGKLQNTTLETIRSCIRSFFEWLKDEDIIKESPVDKIKPYKCKQSVVKYLNIEELELIRENCKDIREKALIEFSYSTGLRLDELNKIDISHINYNNRSVKVLGKGSKERVVFFSPKAAYFLKQYLESRDDNCEALFVTIRKKYRRLSNRAVQRLMTKIGDRAGVHLHLHRLRHSIATNMLSSGIVDISAVSSLLGHSTISTTQIYAKATHLHKQQCYDRFFNQ